MIIIPVPVSFQMIAAL